MAYRTVASKYCVLKDNVGAVVAKIIRLLVKPEEIIARLDLALNRKMIICFVSDADTILSIVSQALGVIKVDDYNKLKFPDFLQYQRDLEILKDKSRKDTIEDLTALEGIRLSAEAFRSILERLNGELIGNPRWVDETVSERLAKMGSDDVERFLTSTGSVLAGSGVTHSDYTGLFSLQERDNPQLNVEKVAPSLDVANPHQANQQSPVSQDAATVDDEGVTHSPTTPSTGTQVEDPAPNPSHYRDHVYNTEPVEPRKPGDYYRQRPTASEKAKGKRRALAADDTTLDTQLKKRKTSPTGSKSQPALDVHSPKAAEISAASPSAIPNETNVTVYPTIEAVQAPAMGYTASEALIPTPAHTTTTSLGENSEHVQTYPQLANQYAHQEFSFGADFTFPGITQYGTGLSYFRPFPMGPYEYSQGASEVSTTSLPTPFEPMPPQFVQGTSEVSTASLLAPFVSAHPQFVQGASEDSIAGLSAPFESFPPQSVHFDPSLEAGPSRSLAQLLQLEQSLPDWVDLQLLDALTNALPMSRRGSSEEVL